MSLLGGLLIAAGVLHVVALVRLAWRQAVGRRGWRTDRWIRIAGWLAGWAATARVVPTPEAAVLTAAVGCVMAGYGWLRRRDLLTAGAWAWASWLLFGTASVWWSLLFVVHLDVSICTRFFMLAGMPFVLVGLPASIVTQRESLEVLLRRRWRHQARALSELASTDAAFVSIQVPCHAEPPQMVIGTLDRLAALEYPNFEVLVIDNNTRDERLWRPVEAHCRALGARFRFLHVEGIAGAKAGALNWARPHIARNAELIAIVDADYHVAPEWLRSTVGFFRDPSVGFVQPPHAYRNWHDRRFLRWANWEYTMFFSTGMVALQEHGAGITVGTMSVIRKRALDDAGGWAEWCLTEDSELAIRVHALGYRSIYLTEPLGWGLIPETFDAYRKQRSRWTYGPVQELRHHWRRFRPAAFGGAPRYRISQRIHHANHGLDVAMAGVRVLAWPFAMGAALSLVVHHEHVPVPLPLWIASTVMLVSGLLIRWQQYCKVTGASLGEACGAIVAYQALTHAITIAALRSAVGLPAEWHRTNKFRVRSHRPLASTRTESSIGVCYLAIAGAVLALGHNGLALMLSIGFVVQALTYLSAPLVATIAAWDLAPTNHDVVELPATEVDLELLSA